MDWERILESSGFYAAIVGAFSLFCAGFVKWFFNRKTNKAEVKSLEISNYVAFHELVKKSAEMS